MSEENGIGHNSGGLNDDQMRALTFHHKREFEVALKAKKDTAANFLAVTKRIKAEGSSIDDIKDLIALDTPEGEVEVRSEIERRLRVARWAGADFGTQFSLLDEPDRTPLVDRAREEGKVAGMKGETLRSPYDGEAGQAYAEGWHLGQAALMSALDLTRAGAEQIAAETAEAEAEESESKDVEAKAPKKRGRPKRAAEPPKPKKSFLEQLRDNNADVERELAVQRH
jgi:hypothetical protein